MFSRYVRKQLSQKTGHCPWQASCGLLDLVLSITFFTTTNHVSSSTNWMEMVEKLRVEIYITERCVLTCLSEASDDGFRLTSRFRHGYLGACGTQRISRRWANTISQSAICTARPNVDDSETGAHNIIVSGINFLLVVQYGIHPVSILHPVEVQTLCFVPGLHNLLMFYRELTQPYLSDMSRLNSIHRVLSSIFCLRFWTHHP